MRRPTSFLVLLVALVAGGGFAFCLPVDGAAGWIPPDFSPVADLKSAHVAGIAPPAFIACTLPDCRFLHPENLPVNRPGSRKGLSDEDDDHSVPVPVAMRARTDEEGDRLQDGTSRRLPYASLGLVRFGESGISRRMSWSSQVIPSRLVRHRRAHAPRDGLATEGDPEDSPSHARPFHPFRSSKPDSLHRSSTDRDAARRPGQPDSVRQKVGA